jgi:hypothetical protein
MVPANTPKHSINLLKQNKGKYFIFETAMVVWLATPSNSSINALIPLSRYAVTAEGELRDPPYEPRPDRLQRQPITLVKSRKIRLWGEGS